MAAGPASTPPPIVGPMPPTARQDLVAALFHVCDADSDGRLSVGELRKFAELAGWFDGSEEEFSKEYEAMCSHIGTDAAIGVDIVLLGCLVNDETEDTGCYCTDEQLQSMLVKLGGAQRPHCEWPSYLRHDGLNSRAELVRAVFHALDINDDDSLDQRELRRFAELTGFEGDDQEWAGAFTTLCAERGGSVDLTFFEWLVDHKSEGSCHCTNDELLSLLKELLDQNAVMLARFEQGSLGLCPRISSSTRTPTLCGEDLVQAIFHVLDRDGDGRLSEREMWQFAVLTGFDGTADQWPEVYEQVCAQGRTTSSDGVDAALFARLAKEDAAGPPCSDEELQDVLARLRGDVVNSGITRALPATYTTQRQAGVAEDCKTAAALLADRVTLGSRTGDPHFDRSLVHTVFRALDVTGGGRLKEAHMRQLAEVAGTYYTDVEWAKVYRLACAHWGVSESADIDVDLFERFVSDNDEHNVFWCTEAQLRGVLAEVRGGGGALRCIPARSGPLCPTAPSSGMEASDERSMVCSCRPPRLELVTMAFHKLGGDHTRRLGTVEIRHLAEHIGLFSSNEGWARLYSTLCSGRAGGEVDLALFTQIVNDTSEDGLFCTDDELLSISYPVTCG